MKDFPQQITFELRFKELNKQTIPQIENFRQLIERQDETYVLKNLKVYLLRIHRMKLSVRRQESTEVYTDHVDLKK